MKIHTAAPWMIVAMILVASIASCSTSSVISRDTHVKDRRIEDVSSVRPNPDALRQEDKPVAIKQLPRVESIGDCAPRYKVGGSGSCINNQPCRGFGVRDDTGKILCSCYGEIGGCSEGQRCDGRKLTCVPEDEPAFGRTPAK